MVRDAASRLFFHTHCGLLVPGATFKYVGVFPTGASAGARTDGLNDEGARPKLGLGVHVVLEPCRCRFAVREWTTTVLSYSCTVLKVVTRGWVEVETFITRWSRDINIVRIS